MPLTSELACLLQAFEVLAERWDSKICPVDGAGKWKHYPFCRHCSMRLQRAGLMGKMPGRGTPAAVILRCRFARRWLRYYDLCHDYLVVSARERGKHGQTQTDPQE